MNMEVGLNEEAGKSTAIRNFIEMRSSNDLVKISTIKNIRNTKIVYLREESLVLLLNSPLHATSCFIVIRKQFCAMWKKQFMLPRKMLNITVFCKAQHNA